MNATTSFNSYCGITPAAVLKTEAAFAELARETGIACALAIDHSGYIIARHGDIEHVRCEELASIAAATFAAYEMIIHTSEMTLDFHIREIENLHFVRVNASVFVLALYDGHCDAAKVREKAKEAALKIRQAIGKEDTVLGRFGSVQFISTKLDEMFKKA
ncbi:MAG: hypothetical protein NTX50_04960 [Candidatus Sumerlaeota bacterium]|nr:hypothetical protein [Candidatus Sumerlaeota bacterium]